MDNLTGKKKKKSSWICSGSGGTLSSLEKMMTSQWCKQGYLVLGLVFNEKPVLEPAKGVEF